VVLVGLLGTEDVVIAAGRDGLVHRQSVLYVMGKGGCKTEVIDETFNTGNGKM
jgi:hypothetical protein